MKNLYFYPTTARSRTEIRNPYTSSLRNALQKYFNVVNAGSPSTRGIFDILKYRGSIDVAYFNWIEELPDKYHGLLQGIFFLFLIRTFRWKGITVVWTLHNKRSHFRRHRLLKDLLFNLMIKRSDLIITHASDGLKLIPEGKRSVCIQHPVRVIQHEKTGAGTEPFDMLIWGTITPYKGIDSFLGYLAGQNILSRYRICIAGKISSGELQEKFTTFKSQSNRLTVLDEFVPEPKLMSLIRNSRMVVFTYHSDSVLSSGALMDSISQLAPIIGPHTGAFKDLEEMGLIDTFRDYRQLVEKIDLALNSEERRMERKTRMERFIQENSWDRFSAEVHRLILQVKDPHDAAGYSSDTR